MTLTLRTAVLAIIMATMATWGFAQNAATGDSTMAKSTVDSIVRIMMPTDTTTMMHVRHIQYDSVAERISRAEAMTDSITKDMEKVLSENEAVMAADAEALLKLPSLDTIGNMKVKRDWSTWRPSPQRAMWLALVLPGAGQIYNRKYWKLPIIYGGFMGCLYALNWNNMMYKDYSQAYLDIMDSDPTTESYNEFLHLGQRITSSNEERYKEIFKNRRNRYRRWRDLSFFCLLGVYALSVIDAYVDAELSEFDISKDLSLKVEPTVINNETSKKILEASSVGIQCRLKF